MSATRAGQGSATSQPTRSIEDVLLSPGHKGVTIGRWTVRWMGDCWSVGEWKDDADRRRWRDATWHPRLEHGLGELMRRNTEGDVSELRELVERVDRAYCGIVRELLDVRCGDES